SIHSRLKERWQQCSKTDERCPSLAPCPSVNQSLSELVGIIQGRDLPNTTGGLAAAVDSLIAEEIDASAVLAQKAGELKKISAQAEVELEYEFANRWNRQLATPGGVPRSLTALLADFPYMEGYLRLAEAEAHALGICRHIIVGGSGPLPITGLVLAGLSNANITLVDSSSEAAEISQHLIDALERTALIRQGQVRVLKGDITAAAPVHSADAVLIASLVNRSAKIELAARVSRMHTAGPRLLLRSALGLCARTAYTAAPRAEIEMTGHTFVGEYVPEHHVVQDISEDHAQKRGVRTTRSSRLLGILPTEVVNSFELFDPAESQHATKT
ncbi:MAG: nicotianamine synthase family protein, partial [Myxococcota bacterium]